MWRGFGFAPDEEERIEAATLERLGPVAEQIDVVGQLIAQADFWLEAGISNSALGFESFVALRIQKRGREKSRSQRAVLVSIETRLPRSIVHFSLTFGVN